MLGTVELAGSVANRTCQYCIIISPCSIIVIVLIVIIRIINYCNNMINKSVFCN